MLAAWSPRSSDPLNAAVRVAGAAIALQTAVSAPLPDLTPYQRLSVARIAGEDLDGALDALNEHLPGIRTRLARGMPVERVLKDYDAGVPAARSAEGEVIRALVPVAVAAEGLRAQAESGPPPGLWRLLDERLAALAVSEPVIHAQLTEQVGAWLATAGRDLPREPPPA